MSMHLTLEALMQEPSAAASVVSTAPTASEDAHQALVTCTQTAAARIGKVDKTSKKLAGAAQFSALLLP